MLNAVCLLVSGLAEEEVDVHHKYDSKVGNVLVGLRVVILGVFFVGLLRVYNRESANIRRFVKKLAAVGGVYLVSWPITVLVAEFLLPNYMHNEVITFV